MKNVACFDLEGPLSPQDNAYELMGLFEDGYRVFELLSRYDDILTLEGRRNYEPGDTLSLIIPFLVYHGISEKDIVKVSGKARIVEGVKEVLSRIKEEWNVYVISTSYSQHALNIARQVGIPIENVFSTRLPLDDFYGRIEGKDLKNVENIEKEILSGLSNEDDGTVKEVLDSFYHRISKTSLGVLNTVKVVGGVRKLNALNEVARKEGKKLSELVAVGDSITDFKMLEAVKNNGGIAVVFNGNKFALPYGNVGLACSSMMPILTVLDSFASGGGVKALKVVRSWQENKEKFLENPEDIPNEFAPKEVVKLLAERKSDKNFLKPDLSCLLDLNESEKARLVELHSKARKMVRGEASKLG